MGPDVRLLDASQYTKCQAVGDSVALTKPLAAFLDAACADMTPPPELSDPEGGFYGRMPMAGELACGYGCRAKNSAQALMMKVITSSGAWNTYVRSQDAPRSGQ
jgi:hypothetical protein